MIMQYIEKIKLLVNGLIAKLKPTVDVVVNTGKEYYNKVKLFVLKMVVVIKQKLG